MSGIRRIFVSLFLIMMASVSAAIGNGSRVVTGSIIFGGPDYDLCLLSYNGVAVRPDQQRKINTVFTSAHYPDYTRVSDGRTAPGYPGCDYSANPKGKSVESGYELSGGSSHIRVMYELNECVESDADETGGIQRYTLTSASPSEPGYQYVPSVIWFNSGSDYKSGSGTWSYTNGLGQSVPRTGEESQYTFSFQNYVTSFRESGRDLLYHHEIFTQVSPSRTSNFNRIKKYDINTKMLYRMSWTSASGANLVATSCPVNTATPCQCY